MDIVPRNVFQGLKDQRALANLDTNLLTTDANASMWTNVPPTTCARSTATTPRVATAALAQPATLWNMIIIRAKQMVVGQCLS